MGRYGCLYKMYNQKIFIYVLVHSPSMDRSSFWTLFANATNFKKCFLPLLFDSIKYKEFHIFNLGLLTKTWLSSISRKKSSTFLNLVYAVPVPQNKIKNSWWRDISTICAKKLCFKEQVLSLSLCTFFNRQKNNAYREIFLQRSITNTRTHARTQACLQINLLCSIPTA